MTAAEFKAAMPAFVNIDDDIVDRYISRSVPFFDINAWGNLLFDGQCNWVAWELIRSEALKAPHLTDMVFRGGFGQLPGSLTTSTGGLVDKQDEKNRLSDQVAAWALASSTLAAGYRERYLELRKIAGKGWITA